MNGLAAGGRLGEKINVLAFNTSWSGFKAIHLQAKVIISVCLLKVKVNVTKFCALINVYKQNRSTEGCSKLKRSVDMTSSGKNGLNIRTKCKYH